jgi:UDP-N-acetylglucosamine 2-epimerase (non-hydrolysing)
MIHIIIGTKAQLIKMAPIMKLLGQRGIDYNYISTGQHRETMDDILANFGIKQPDHVTYSGRDITSVIQMFIWGLRNIVHALRNKQEIFRNDANGIVLVHGDTFSTLLGALMGKIAGLKVGHVESGLRSFNLFHPFPEEIIRMLVFRLSDYMFAPGDWACANLQPYRGVKINTMNNTLLDSLANALPAIQKVTDIDLPSVPFGVVTLHRFENIYSKAALERVVTIVERISKSRHLLFILHKPTEIKLRKFGCLERLAENSAIELRKRYDYFRFIKLIMEAEFVISDGGSNQEECLFLGKPILLLRKATERTEGLLRNCVLSEYDNDIIDAFVADPGRYRYDPLHLNDSPSQAIITHCMPYA